MPRFRQGRRRVACYLFTQCQQRLQQVGGRHCRVRGGAQLHGERLNINLRVSRDLVRKIPGCRVHQANAKAQHAVGVRHMFIEFGARKVAAVTAHPTRRGFRNDAFGRRHIGEGDGECMCDLDH